MATATTTDWWLPAASVIRTSGYANSLIDEITADPSIPSSISFSSEGWPPDDVIMATATTTNWWLPAASVIRTSNYADSLIDEITADPRIPSITIS